MYVARNTFDRLTSYNLENMDERKWLRRFLFLETVAGKLSGHKFLALDNALCVRVVGHTLATMQWCALVPNSVTVDSSVIMCKCW